MVFRSSRPKDNRPAARAAGRARPVSAPLFSELLSTRARYEAVRSSDGSFLERAILLDRLHELRFELARGARI